MNARQKLHELIDHLPETELQTAVRILEALEERFDPVAHALRAAPDDDEPDDDDRDGGLSEALDESEFESHHELKSRLLK